MMWVLIDSKIAVKKKKKATGDAEKSNHIHYCRKVSSEMLNAYEVGNDNKAKRYEGRDSRVKVGSIYSSFKTLSTITGAVERTVGQATTLNFSNTKGTLFSFFILSNIIKVLPSPLELTIIDPFMSSIYHLDLAIADKSDEAVLVGFDGEMTKLTNIRAPEAEHSTLISTCHDVRVIA
ncbi:hypothetical protein Bca52824_017819 [Brassica carinata]|uniref:Uncharacterized protein n=1 Tax=Brassica carinata TaxID=52824 RepID=A0A8X8AYR3_BRACI|nr:hypothetical protein Bca52824_017819 [Brassica carinata]